MRPPLPPESFRRLVCGDEWEQFETHGEGLVGMMRHFGMIFEGASLLDIGCGCGRLARFLVESPVRSYTGFDRHRGMIEWCQETFGTLDPRFRFEHFDLRSVYATLDGEEGRWSVSEFDFPYGPDSFDGILAASVFTHLPPEDVQGYLERFATWLRPEGRALVSVFHSESESHQYGLGFSLLPNDWLRMVDHAGLVLERPFPLRFGSLHNWYILSRATSD